LAVIYDNNDVSSDRTIAVMRIFILVILLSLGNVFGLRTFGVGSMRHRVIIPMNDADSRHSFALNAYEVVHSIDATLAGQLFGCGSVVGAGFVQAAVEPEKSEMTGSPVEKKYDIYRDSILRYAGYLNEIGEAFRPLVPGTIVIASYVLALTYVGADAVSKGIDAGKLTPVVPEEDRTFYNSFVGCTTAAAIDTLSFQLLASIFFPGFIINRWVTLCGYLTHDVLDTSFVGDGFALGPYTVDAAAIADGLPTLMGLLLIPIIVTPLDALTEKILDTTIRPFLATRFPPCALPF